MTEPCVSLPQMKLRRANAQLTPVAENRKPEPSDRLHSGSLQISDRYEAFQIFQDGVRSTLDRLLPDFSIGEGAAGMEQWGDLAADESRGSCSQSRAMDWEVDEPLFGDSSHLRVRWGGFVLALLGLIVSRQPM
ncbi:MAG TPA: hypothetical protein VJX67_14775 [Blastocatellia bacterium]|nr:hypothetical protein [Blastocatellia bacterium]